MFAQKIWLIKKPNKYKVLLRLLRTKAWRHGTIMGWGWLGVLKSGGQDARAPRESLPIVSVRIPKRAGIRTDKTAIRLKPYSATPPTAAKRVANSPFLYKSTTMSQPPTNSPLIYNCG